MSVAVAILLGAFLGAGHCAGLWLSVRSAVAQPRSLAWLAATTLIRFGVLGLAIAALQRSQLGVALAAFAGFWVGRSLVMLRYGGIGHAA